jgi:hypothetical protein
MFEEKLNFLTKEECNNVIDYFKNNFLYHSIYRDTISLEITNNFKERSKIVNFIQSHNLKLNYDLIVMWPNGSFMNTHFDGTKEPNNHYTSICYLNENYIGGRTLIKNNFVKNEVGKLVWFNSKEIEHGVEKVIGTRLVYIAWYNKL